jgi:DNA uptake protein ComE-like DNA-binding protein
MKNLKMVPAILTLGVLLSATACGSGDNKAADSAAVADTTAAMAVTPDTATQPAASTTTTGAAASSTTIKKININTATDAEILAIPGMGPRMLREFKEYRPYTSIEQFRREIGKYVDKAEVARLEQYITIK